MPMTQGELDEGDALVARVKERRVPLPFNLPWSALAAARMADPDYRLSTNAWIAIRSAIIDEHSRVK